MIGHHSTSKIIQGLGQSVLGTSLSVIGSLQTINDQVTYLPLWHGTAYTLAAGFPLFALVDGIVRIIRGVEGWYKVSQLKSDISYTCTPSTKTCRYINAAFMLLSAVPECAFSYPAILNIVTTGFNASLSITPLAMGFALTSLIDMVRSMQEMFLQESKDFDAEVKQCFSKPAQEIVLNMLKMLGWFAIAAGSPYGWAFLVLGFTAQLCITAMECQPRLEPTAISLKKA